MNTEERIRSLTEYLKYDYCNDRINTYYYREYLSLLKEASKDQITRFKIDRMINELPADAKPEDYK